MNCARALKMLASLFAVSFAGLAGGGCSVTATAPEPTCGIDDTFTCNGGIGYSCTGDDQPRDLDPSLLCSSGIDGNAGSTLYCCLHEASGTSCGPDSTVAGCPGGSFGFSCADATEPPNGSYPSLHCSAPTSGNAGSALYCCAD